jgi:uncharacterized MAPEG superfamily protein
MLLAFAVWTVVVLVIGVGVYRWSNILTGRAELRQYLGDEPQGPAFYRRAMRAHANCVENLPVFAAIVLAIEASGAGAPVLDALAVTVVAARVLQTVTHWSSGSNMAVAIRFAFFAIQLLAFAWMALQVALHASWGAPN